MNITFLGATKTVTGSNFLVEAAGKKFLVDCGMYQGQAQEELENAAPFAFDIHDIDFVILTHAHIDHSGRIPKLYNEGYRKKIYATKATCDLCAIMLPDSGHIQEMEVEWRNRKRKREGKPELPPLYTAEEAATSLEIFEPIAYQEKIQVTDNIHLRFQDAGHMLGSAIVEIWVTENGKEEKIVFTGDLGNDDIPLMPTPAVIEEADYLIMESTYGNRLHIRNDSKAEEFLSIVAETLDKKGTVVIPSFAVGRTQEILYELNNLKDTKHDAQFYQQYKTLMQAPVYVDSPLAISATEVFMENMELFDEETQKLIQSGNNPLEFPGLKFTRTADESRALNESPEPAIIISASGMCEVGRIKHHLKHNLWNPNSTVLFVGYQAEGTLGRKLIEGTKMVKIFGEEIAVNARIEYIEGYSGHADQEMLLDFVGDMKKKPKQIFLVHGEPEGQKILKEKLLEQEGIPVHIPEYGESYVLDENAKVIGVYNQKAKQNRYSRLEILDRMQTLREELEDMELIVKEEYLQEDTEEQTIETIKERLKQLESEILRIVENK